jgi:superfamily I DNA and RNA helicase
MKKFVYGLDSNNEFGPIELRDAIIECFSSAHCKEYRKMKSYSGDSVNISSDEFERFKKFSSEMLVKKVFKKIGGDFDAPNKKSLMKVIRELMEFASNFRLKDEIEKHFNEIRQLVDKLE